MTYYDVVRFHKTGRKRVIWRGITKEQAQDWCSNPLTRKEGKYFDGWSSTGEYSPDSAAYYIHCTYFTPTAEYH